MRTAVVLSTYNGEKFIVEQLQSIFEQTRAVDKVYISDDCSKDRTVELIRDFIENRHLTNWSIAINNTNQGWKKNYKALIMAVQEDIIFLCDQDDIWYANKVEEMMSIMENNERMDLLACGYDAQYDDNTRRITRRITRHMRNSKKVERIRLSEKCLDVLRPGCAMAVRKAFCERIGQEWDTLLPHDAMLWRCAVLNGSAYIYDQNLFSWRRYNTSSSNPNKNEGQYENKYKMLYEFYIGNCQSHLLYLKCAQRLILKGVLQNDESAQSIILSSQKCENEILNAFKNKSVLEYLTSAIKYWKYMPSLKTVMWNSYVIFKTK